MLTPMGLADNRFSQTFKDAITKFLLKPGKEDEELEIEPTADYVTHSNV